MKSQKSEFNKEELYLASKGKGYVVRTKKFSDKCGNLFFIEKNKIIFTFVQIKPIPSVYEGESIDLIFEDGDAMLNFLEAYDQF